MIGRIKTRNYDHLVGRIAEILREARTQVVREINKVQVLAYWEIGREIVEFEQKGKARAEYGEELILKLSRDLTERLGRGFSKSNLFLMRQFYLTYPEKFQTMSGKSEINQILSTNLELMLSWSHYCELLRIEEPLARSFYEQEAVQNK